MSLRSKSNSPLRRVRNRNDSPARVNKNISNRQKMKIVDQIEKVLDNSPANTTVNSVIKQVSEENKIGYVAACRYFENKNLISILPQQRIRCPGGGAKPQFPRKCEFELYIWVRWKNENAFKVSYENIRDKAQELLEAYNNEFPEQARELKFGPCWIKNFMNRNGLALRRKTHQAKQQIINNSQMILKFFEYICRLNKQTKEVPLNKIVNMDEVPYYFDMPSKQTITAVGIKSVSIADTGYSKSRFSVIHSITASGKMLDTVLLLDRKTIDKKWTIPPMAIRARNYGLIYVNIIENAVNYYDVSSYV